MQDIQNFKIKKLQIQKEYFNSSEMNETFWRKARSLSKTRVSNTQTFGSYFVWRTIQMLVGMDY